MIRAAYFLCFLLLALPAAARAAGVQLPPPAPVENHFDLARNVAAESVAADLLPPLPGFADVSPAEQRFKDAAILRSGDVVDIDVHYPIFGNALIDRDISLWAHRVVETFSNGFKKDPSTPRQVQNELKASYTVSYASPRSLTVTYEVWTYTGGIHGNNDVITLSYDVESGQRLFFEDLVAATDTALQKLSAYCYKVLAANLGEDLDEEMLKNGTAPELDNYASFSLFPAGLRIHFQPYQVAPFAAGAQRVDVPLEEVFSAGPRLEFWGRTKR